MCRIIYKSFYIFLEPFMNNRRHFLVASGAFLGSALLSTQAFAQSAGNEAKSIIRLPPLPFDLAALEPFISANTLGFHYGKHHKGYLDNLNKLIIGTPFEAQSLESIVKESSLTQRNRSVFNNAAQVWNHTFFWNSLSSKGSAIPGNSVMLKIKESFGSLPEFRTAFVAASTTVFGSGWLWIALEKSTKKLVLVPTTGADTPITGATYTPLAVLDVWEHAYYLDYQNRRADYAKTVFESIINWEFVEKNLEAALA
jgi:superoxide dismutase, Fe-Mn family